MIIFAIALNILILFLILFEEISVLLINRSITNYDTNSMCT